MAANLPGSATHEAAVTYASRGWRVIPLWWLIETPSGLRCACPKSVQCGRNAGKHPRLEAWGTVATTDPATLAGWWARWPHANVGIVAGQASGLAIVDIDPRNGGDESLRELEKLYQPFPDTPQVLSGGGGWHYYFSSDEDLPGIDLAPGVNFLADTSHQVVAPPSLHPSGKAYVWELSSHPEDTPLAPLPEWVKALVRSVVQERVASAATLPHDLPAVRVTALTISQRMRQVIETGDDPDNAYPSRSEAVFAVIQALIHAQYDDATIAAVLLNPAWGISEKPLTQKNPRSPLYRELTRGWVAKEIARGRGKKRPAPARTREREPQAQDAEGTTQDLPHIQITTDMTTVVDTAVRAIQSSQAPAPWLFQRARQLCVIAKGIPPPKWIQRPAEAPTILPASPAALREYMAATALWKKYDKRSRTWEQALPPAWAVETLLARTSWPFPPLEGVVTSPTLRPDGSLIDISGYDVATGFVLDLNGQQFPPLRPWLTIDDARTALGTLQEAFTDFPWEADWHFSGALAALLTVMMRCAIRGRVPLIAVTATTPGSGKSLLVDVISVIATGSMAPRWAQTHEEEEDRKRILTIALAGDPLVLIDNVVAPLGSGALDMAITADVVSDRVLGSHTQQSAPMHSVFFASGNNMAFRGDMARRVLPITLDPKMERPEERTTFRHTPLLPWVHQERPALVMAAITLVAAYFAAGCPTQDRTVFGSFEAWGDLIRGALLWAGEADPLAGRAAIQATQDPEFEAWGALLEHWGACYGQQSCTIGKALDEVALYTQSPSPESKWAALAEALKALDARYDGKHLNARSIGKTFARWEKRVIGGKRLVKHGAEHRAVLWRLENLTSGTR